MFWEQDGLHDLRENFIFMRVTLDWFTATIPKGFKTWRHVEGDYP